MFNCVVNGSSNGLICFFKEKMNALRGWREMERTRTKGQHCCVRVKFQQGVCLSAFTGMRLQPPLLW